jgi:beta-N-acetylhexosaminidase
MPEHATSLSLDVLVGQLFVVNVSPEGRLGDALWFHRQYHYGGVFLGRKNFRSEEQVRGLTQRLRRQEGEIPSMLVCTDEEGGLVSSMGDLTATGPSAQALGVGNNLDVTRDVYQGMGDKMRAMGVNVVFAPVLDVNSEPHNPVIGTRAFGSTVEIVAKHGQAACDGLREAGVAACVKHFPGHGSTSLDSHATLPVVKATREALHERELETFREVFAKDPAPELVMTAHVAYPALDKSGVPATFSAPILQGLLRREMGYQGVIVTDAMEMGAVTERHDPEEAAVAALEAGVDLLLYALDPDMSESAYRAVLRAVESGKIPVARVQESVDRVFKLRHVLQNKPWVNDEEVEEILDMSHDQVFYEASLAGIEVEGDATVLARLAETAGPKLAVFPKELDEHRPLALSVVREQLTPAGFTVMEVSGVPTPAEVSEVTARAAEATAVVVATASRGKMKDANRTLLRAAFGRDVLRVGVALLDPQDVEEMGGTACRLKSFGFAVPQLWAVCHKLVG